MPRLTVVRIILLPIVCFLILVLLFVALPAVDRVNHHNYNHYHQDVLHKGVVLTTSYKNERLYDSPNNVDNVEYEWFAIDWQLIPNVEQNSIGLRIGNTTVDLTRLVDLTPVDNTPAAAQLITTAGRTGHTGGVMLPWFPPQDASLLNWHIDRDVKVVDLQAILVEPGVIQIWPESRDWHRDPLEMPYPGSRTPVLTVSNISINGDRTNIRRIVVADMTPTMPTWTFPVRLYLLIVLKPIVLKSVDILNEFVLPLGKLVFDLVWFAAVGLLCYSGIVLICWRLAGRPDFDEWSREGVLTRGLCARNKRTSVHVSGGLVDHVDEEKGLEIEGSDGDAPAEFRRLRSTADFFRSQSPLDDLFNTFESTRWLTRPLFKVRAKPEAQFEPSDGVTITTAPSDDVNMKTGG